MGDKPNNLNRQVTSYRLRQKLHQILDEWDGEVEDTIISKAQKIIYSAEILKDGLNKKKKSKEVKEQARDIIRLLGGEVD